MAPEERSTSCGFAFSSHESCFIAIHKSFSSRIYSLLSMPKLIQQTKKTVVFNACRSTACLREISHHPLIKLFFYCRVTVTPLKICGAKVSCKQAERENKTISATKFDYQVQKGRLSHLISASPPLRPTAAGGQCR